MTTSTYKTTNDGLSHQFITSLRVLFDILDEENSGYVRLGDIESRWQDSTVAGLPNGVVDGLRKVAPPSGKISFERFVAGLKIALLKSRNGNNDVISGPKSKSILTLGHSLNHGVNGFPRDSSSSANGHTAQENVSRPPTQSLLPQPHKPAQTTGPNMATVRPNNALAPQTHSQNTVTAIDSQNFSIPNQASDHQPHHALPAPVTTGRESIAEPQRDAWQTRQRGQYHSASSISNPQSLFANRRAGDGRSSVASASALDTFAFGTNRRETEREFGASKEAEFADGGRQNMKSKRADPRRHTLSSGIDYNMIKRMKQLEQEKDVLLQGLEAVELARDWYNHQIHAVQEKQKYVSRGTSPNDISLDASQERINQQVSMILQLNQQLKTLVDSSEKGLPQHMNLAVSSTPPRPTATGGRSGMTGSAEKDNTISRLQSLNKSLAMEVRQKADMIEQLEREKAQIIKELFAKQANKTSNSYEYDDTTFI